MNKAFLIITLAFMSSLPGCIDDWGHMGGYGPMGNMMYYGYGYGGIFMWALLLIMIGVAVYLVMQNARLRGAGGRSQETPLEILKKRYAKGEISKEEYETMKKDIQ